MEFALAAPVLLLLGAGIIDYGWYYSNQHTLVVASQEAIRAGMDAGLDEDPAALAQERAQEALAEAGAEHLGAEVETELSGSAPDIMLEVRIEAEFHELVGVVPVPTHLSNRLVTRLTHQ